MIRLAKGIDLAKKPNFDLQKKTNNSFRKPPKRKNRNSPNPLEYEIVDPQEGLVPLFNSPFYTTPDTPADPTDCNRYPDSPWCGENPVDISSPVGIELSIVLDECNFGVQFSGTFGFIKVPPFQIVYRSPNCQSIEEQPALIGVVPHGTPIPKDPAKCASGVFINLLAEKYVDEHGINSDGYYYYFSTIISEVIGAKYPLKEKYTIPNSGGTLANFYVDIKVDENTTANSAYFRRAGALTQSQENAWKANGGTLNGNRSDMDTEWSLQYTATVRVYYNTNTRQLSLLTLSHSNPSAHINLFAALELMNASTYNALPSSTVRNIQRATLPDVWNEVLVYRFALICGDINPIEPPPPPKEECCKMGCCPDNSDLERLLRLILKKIGSDDLPASVPKVLTKKDAGTIQIQNLAEFISYTVKQLDALAGKYPLEIKIKDADLTQEGDQEKKISLPNIAEALAEIMGILLILQSESNANLIATTNGMIEAGSAKQAATLAVDYAKGNAEYLGYKGKQVERKVPFTFKPGEPRLDKMLAKGEVKVKGWENDDKEDLNDALAPLLELAAMWKAANFKNLGTNDPLSKLKEVLRGAVNLSDETDKLVKDSSPANSPNQPKKNEWDSFIEEAEQGFIAQPGITDSTNPYGRPLAQRPKIREIGNDTSDVDEQDE